MAKRSDHLIEFNQDVKEFGAGSGPLVCGSTSFPAMLSRLLSAGLKLVAAAAAVAVLVYLAAVLYVGFAPLSIKADSARINIKLYNHKEETVSYHLVLFDKHDKITRVMPDEDGTGIRFFGKHRGGDYRQLQITEGKITNVRQTLFFDDLTPGTSYEVLIVADKDGSLTIAGRFPFTTDNEEIIPEDTPPSEEPPAPAATEPAKPAPVPESTRPQETEPEETEPEPTKPQVTIPPQIVVPPSDPKPEPSEPEPSEPESSVAVTGEMTFKDKSAPVDVEGDGRYGYTINLTFTTDGEEITPVQIDLEGKHHWSMEDTEPRIDSYGIEAADITGTSVLTATLVIEPENGIFEFGFDAWTAVLTFVDENGNTGTAAATGAIAPEPHVTQSLKSCTITRLESYNTGWGDPRDQCSVEIEAFVEIIPGFEPLPELILRRYYITPPAGSMSISSSTLGFSGNTDYDELTMTKTGTYTYSIKGKTYMQFDRKIIDDDPFTGPTVFYYFLGDIDYWATDNTTLKMTIKEAPGYNPDINQGAPDGFSLSRPEPEPEPEPTPDPVPDYSGDAVILPALPEGTVLLDVIRSGVNVSRLETVSAGELVQIRIRVTAATDAADGEQVTLTPPGITSSKVVVTQPAPSTVAASGGAAADTFWYSFYMPDGVQIDDLTVTPAV